MNDSAGIARFTIRQATLADCDGILQCLHSAFEPFKNSYTLGAYNDTVLNRGTLECRLREMTVYVAISESKEVVGTIACKIIDSEEGHLRGMAVLPSWQGRGLAQQLLDQAQLQLRESGCKRITLDTTAPLKRAVSFYRRNGFRATGRVSDFFGMQLFEYAKKL